MTCPPGGGAGRLASLLEALETATRDLSTSVARGDVTGAHRGAQARQAALDELSRALDAEAAASRAAFLAAAGDRLGRVRAEGEEALEGLHRLAHSARKALEELRRRGGAARRYEAIASPEGLALNRSG